MQIRTVRSLLSVATLVIGFTLIGAVLWMRFNGYQFLSVQSGSMEPALRKGDLVLVTHVPPKELQRGDIITFVSPGADKAAITHRILETPNVQTGQRFVTKGDANPSPDSSILPSAIIGKEVHNVPYLGYATDVVRNPIGLLLLIYVPAIWVIAGEIKRLKEYYRKNQPYIDAQLAWTRRVYSTPRNLFAPVAVVIAAGAVGIAGIYHRPAQAGWNRNTTTVNSSTIATAPIQPATAPEPIPVTALPEASPTPTPTPPAASPSPTPTPSPKPAAADKKPTPTPTPTPAPTAAPATSTSWRSGSDGSWRRR